MASDYEMNATQAFIDDDFELAVHLYSQAISHNPENAELYANRAQAQIKLDNLIDAVADAEKASELQPSLSKSYLRKGIACIKLEQYHRAKAALEAGISLSPEDSRFADLIKVCEEHTAENHSNDILLETISNHLKQIPHPVERKFTTEDSSCYFDAEDTSTSELRTKIGSLVSAAEADGFVFQIPVRTKNNAVFIPRLQRYVLKRKTSSRPNVDRSEDSYARTLAVLKTLQDVLASENINYVTKRGLYYANTKVFGNESQINGIIDDITSMLGCTRSNLRIVAKEKGVVVGNLRYTENGDAIDCSKVGAIGKPIFSDIKKISNLKSNALLVLLVESHALFTMLANERFYQRIPCVIVTGGGMPDVGTRLFLQKLRYDLKLPVIALTDCDPFGISIMSVYRYGSFNLAFQDFTTPDVKWLGLKPSELDRLRISNLLTDLSEEDNKKLKDLSGMACMKNAWLEELVTMRSKNKKAEFEVLYISKVGFSVQEYLTDKLSAGDWI